MGKRKYVTARLSNTTICLKTFLNTNISINWNTVYLEDLIKMETSAAILKACFRGFLRLNFETQMQQSLIGQPGEVSQNSLITFPVINEQSNQPFNQNIENQSLL